MSYLGRNSKQRSHNFMRESRMENCVHQIQNVERRPAQHESSWEVDSLIQKIKKGNFSHYVKGGFSRSRGVMVTPAQVAHMHGLNFDLCILSKLKDPCIEIAAKEAGLIIVGPSTFIEKRHNPRKRNTISVWKAADAV